MKERKVKKFLTILIAGLGIALLLFMQTRAGTYTERIRIATANYDSVQFRAMVLRAGGWEAQTSVSFTSFPESTDVTIYTDSQYHFEYDWWLNGSFTEGSNERIGFVQSGEYVAGGSGSNDWTIFVMDTTGGNDTTGVSKANITIRDMAGGLDGELTTGTSGDRTFTVDLDSFTVQVTKAGTLLNDGDIDTLVVAAHGQVDTTWVVFDGVVDPSSPGSPNLCNVYGFVYDNQQAVVPYAELEFTLSGEEGKDSCNNTILIGWTQKAETDSVGYFLIPLIQTPCVQNSDWTVTVTAENDLGQVQTRSHSFAIPTDSTTYLLVF